MAYESGWTPVASRKPGGNVWVRTEIVGVGGDVHVAHVVVEHQGIRRRRAYASRLKNKRRLRKRGDMGAKVQKAPPTMPWL